LTNSKAIKVNSQQQEAMDTFVEKMDLMQGYVDEDGDVTEGLELQYMFNPSIAKYKDFLHYRAMHPTEPLPELRPELEAYLKPSEKLLKDAADAGKALKDLFPLEVRVKKGKKTAAETWQQMDEQGAKRAKDGDGAAAAAAGGDDAGAASSTTPFSMASLMKDEVKQVGSTTPIEDYNALISRTTEDNLETASKQLMKRIEDVVDLYAGGDAGKFTAMVTILRQELKTDHPTMFNGFLRQLLDTIDADSGRKIFRQELEKHHLTLISNDESSLSTITPAEATNFLKRREPVVSTTSAPPVDEEDLLEEI